jgi:hypothetical protein
MWPMLSGRKWLSTLPAILSGLAVFSAPGLIGWTYRYPGVQLWLLDKLPWFIGVVVTLRFCAAAAVSVALVRRGILPPSNIAALMVCWIAFCAAIIAIASAYAPWTWYLPAAVILMLPLVRIGLAPLALDWNRHR